MFLKGSIKINPTPKARPKLTRDGRAYNPRKTRDAQRQQAFLFSMLAKQAEAANPAVQFPVPTQLPLCVTVRFWHNGGKKGHPKRTIPDIDNLLKLTLDALTKARIWKDDNQITKLISEDLWAGDEPGKIEIEIEEHKIPGLLVQQELFTLSAK